MSRDQKIVGLLVEFDSADKLVEAAGRTEQAGYRHFECYSPYPVHGLAEAMNFRKTRVPLLVLIGGIIGAIGGYGMQYWMSVIDYPLNIGGRPMNSWPSFMPVTFETTVLTAALFAVLGMLALNGLPRPHHPLFAVEGFERATRDGFFLCIYDKDKKFDLEETRDFLQTLDVNEVIDVPA